MKHDAAVDYLSIPVGGLDILVGCFALSDDPDMKTQQRKDQ